MRGCHAFFAIFWRLRILFSQRCSPRFFTLSSGQEQKTLYWMRRTLGSNVSSSGAREPKHVQAVLTPSDTEHDISLKLLHGSSFIHKKECVCKKASFVDNTADYTLIKSLARSHAPQKKEEGQRRSEKVSFLFCSTGFSGND